MAFFGTQNSGGLFGGGEQRTFAPIVGISSNLIALDAQARLSRISLASLSAADQQSIQSQFGRSDGPAVIPPWQIPEDVLSLNEQIRSVRSLTSFIDLEDPILDTVSDNADHKATFVLFNALTNLRVLAEYASEDSTLDSSLGRLDDQFRSGLDEVRDYLSSTELETLDIFLGEKEYTTEATTRTGKNQSESSGTYIVDDPDGVIEGLTGTEVFTVSIEKSGNTDNISVDLSGIAGDLSLNNVVDHINAQIEALSIPIAKTLTTADFNSDDESLTTVRIDTTATGLQLNGVDVTDAQEIAVADIVAGNLTYTPPDGSTEGTLTGFQYSTDEGAGYPGSPSTFDTAENFTAKNLTRFNVQRNDSTGQYGLKIEGTITEEVTLTAVAAAPTLYAVSATSQLDDSFAVSSRITAFNNIDATIEVGDTTSFAAIDYAATEIKGLVAETEDDDLDPAIASLRDKFLADAADDVSGDDDDTSTSDVDDDNTSSITNVNSEDRVSANTAGSRVAVDSAGGIYVVGTSAGSFGHQLNVAATQDVFLTKFDSEGNVAFSRLLGVAESAEAFDIKVDSNDNVIIAGATDSALSEKDIVEGGGSDAFVVKISKRGDEVFRYQLDTFGTTAAYSIAVDSNNDIYVGGSTSTAISAATSASGGNDALILTLDGSSGAVTDSTVFGTSGNDVIKGLALDGNNDLIVALDEDGSASVARILASDLSTQVASVSLGDLGAGGEVTGVTIDTNTGKFYVSGVTTNGTLDAGGDAAVNGTADGGLEGFVSGFSFSGTTGLAADFTSYLSTGGTDGVSDLTVQDGKLYVAGSTTGTLAGETARGATDGYIARLDGATGAIENTEQYGEGLARSAVGGVAFTNRGESVLKVLGLPTGLIEGDQTRDLETQTTAREGDYFYVKFGDGLRKKIELESGDTFDDIKRKLRVAGFGKIDADVSSTTEGEKLKISALDEGVSIDLIPGSGDKDLLSRIGLKAGKLLPKNEVFDINLDDEEIAPEDDLGGVFGLKLDGALNLQDKATAKYVLGLLDTAISTVQRAYRSTNFDPVKQQLLNEAKFQGSVSPRIAAQIANFQTGLSRLQSGASSPSVSLFA